MASKGNPPRLKLTYPDPSEDQLQESIANFLDAVLRPEEAVYTHIPVGGYILSPRARGRLYRIGVKKGFPDICIAYKPGRILWLELKTATGRLTLDQEQRHAQLFVLGHNVVTCRRIEDVISAMELHRVPFRKAQIGGSYYGTNVASEAPSAAAQSTQGIGSISTQTS